MDSASQCGTRIMYPIQVIGCGHGHGGGNHYMGTMPWWCSIKPGQTTPSHWAKKFLRLSDEHSVHSAGRKSMRGQPKLKGAIQQGTCVYAIVLNDQL